MELGLPVCDTQGKQGKGRIQGWLGNLPILPCDSPASCLDLSVAETASKDENHQFRR